MKSIPFILLCAFIMSCENSFTGYVIGKQYIPSHMEIKNENVMVYNIVLHTVFPTPFTTKEKVPSQFCLYVANRKKVKCFKVDSSTYEKTKIFQEITFKN